MCGLLFIKVLVAFLSVVAGTVYNNSIMPRPRFQWNENYGYCGEVSTIIATMSSGGFLSQYDLRQIAAQYKEKSQTAGEYLLGVNDEYTAKALKLRSVSWNSEGSADSKQFLKWIKGQHLSGNVVSIGVFTNEYLFYGDTDPSAGDSEYDHIVTVYSIETADANTDDYLPDDIITISDHGLWNPHGKNSDYSTAKYLFSYNFDEFQGNRKQANSESGSVYTLPNNVANYAIAHLGPLGSALVPVRVESNVNYESPEIEKRSNDRPDAMSNVVLTVVVGPLLPATSYIVYRYDNEEMIPSENFNALANQSVFRRDILLSDGSTTFTFTENVKSSDKVFYRCVLSSAP